MKAKATYLISAALLAAAALMSPPAGAGHGRLGLAGRTTLLGGSAPTPGRSILVGRHVFHLRRGTGRDLHLHELSRTGVARTTVGRVLRGPPAWEGDLRPQGLRCTDCRSGRALLERRGARVLRRPDARDGRRHH